MSAQQPQSLAEALGVTMADLMPAAPGVMLMASNRQSYRVSARLADAIHAYALSNQVRPSNVLNALISDLNGGAQ